MTTTDEELTDSDLEQITAGKQYAAVAVGLASWAGTVRGAARREREVRVAK